MATARAIGGRLPQFFEYYGRKPSRAERAVEREVFGTAWGITSYTTAEQAETLADALCVGPRARVLDIGSGTGWPGLYLADRTGCRAVLTDVPRDAMRSAAGNAYRRGLATTCGFAVASGERLPFRPGTFDAVLHSDVLWCLNEKLSVLRACGRVLRRGGRIAYYTIFVAEELPARERRRIGQDAPEGLYTHRGQQEMLKAAGFQRIRETDVTAEYLRVQRALYEANERHQRSLRRVLGDAKFEDAQSSRKVTLACIEAGHYRRSLFVGERP